MVWIVFASMVLVAMGYLILPFLREERMIAPRKDYDVLVYRDQLAEVDRDIQRGLLLPDQADAARTEIYKCMMLAENMPVANMGANAKGGKRIALIVILFLLPFGSILTYAYLGSPELPAKPYVERKNDPDFLVAGEAEKLAVELAAKPDANNYARLGDMYSALHSFDKAVGAYEKASELNAKDPTIWSGLGQAIALAQGGMIVPEARDAFIKALQIDAHEPSARFYLGMAELQIGEYRKAIAIWRDLEKDSPPDAPWLAMVKDRIAVVSKKEGFDPATIVPSAPSLVAAPNDMAKAIMGMGASDQKAAIHTMVDRLAAKLKDNPNDIDGWERLARSYRVLGENDKAIQAEQKLKELKMKGSKK